MVLRAEDGSVLEVKEPIVLDKDGEPLSIPTEDAQQEFQSSFFARGKTFQMGWLSTVLFVLLVGALLTLGTAFIGVFFAVLLAISLVRFLLRSFGFRP